MQQATQATSGEPRRCSRRLTPRCPNSSATMLGGVVGRSHLQRGAALVDGESEREERTALLFGGDEAGQVAEVDDRRRTRPAPRRRRWPYATRAWSRTVLPLGESVGHRARVERAGDRQVDRLGDERHRTPPLAVGRGVTQAQSSPHGPSTGSPLSCSAAVWSWAANAVSSAIWRCARADLVGDQLVEASLHRSAAVTVPDRRPDR